MEQENYIWEIQKTDEHIVKLLKDKLDISNALAQILSLRGVKDFNSAQDFFRPKWNSFHDGFLMKDMSKSVERIHSSINEKQNILVYGDYDVDGTCSVAMISIFLKQYNSNVSLYQPDRENEGYGISIQSVDKMIAAKIDLVIALDCGIKDIKSAKAINDAGIDLIICDHHNPGNIIPQAYSILNPKQKDCKYPFKELCGCGVGFKLIQSYSKKYNLETDYSYLIQLAAIATTADVVPLVDENRLITYFGLEQINQNPIASIEKIFQLSNTTEFSSSDLIFKVAPRINAAGRLSSAKKATDFLISNNEELETLSAEIELINKERREIDEVITQEALSQLSTQPSERFTNLVYSADWHKGVVGIVASRIIENHYKPTIVLTGKGDVITGSARSVKDFNIYNELEKLKHYFIRFGGHKYAAGMSIKKTDLVAFFNDFENAVKKSIQPHMLVPKIKIDSELSINELAKDSKTNNFPKIYRIIKQIGPFGAGNPTPVFLFNDLKLFSTPKIVGEKHIKLKFCNDKLNSTIDGIWFNSFRNFEKIRNRKHLNVVASLSENYFNGITSLQLMLKDAK
tara:strand:- start:5332 stop:7044 length:1713 start_codon:yes stop_codon:yes gene_type:complete